MPYCSVKSLVAEKMTQSLEVFEKSIDLLKSFDCLALVVYPRGSEWHTVVLGCDLCGEFFIRDPNFPNIRKSVDLNKEFSL